MPGTKVDWWEADTKKKYKEKQQCFIDLYNGYTFEVIYTLCNISCHLSINKQMNGCLCLLEKGQSF